MTLTKPSNIEIVEGQSPFLMSYVQVDGAAGVQADFSAGAYATYDMAAPATEITTGSLTISSVVFDTLQTDARWDVDSTGYNFGWQAPASLFPDGGTVYRVKVTLTLTGGAPVYLSWNVYARDVLGV